jgi:type II secretion system protein C
MSPFMNKSVLQKINLFLIAIFIILFLQLILIFWAKPYGIESEHEQEKSFFELYTLSKSLNLSFAPPIPKDPVVITKNISAEVMKYDPYMLSAIISGKGKEFIMLQNGTQTELINKGTTFKIYKLIEIEKDSATFEVYGNKVKLYVGKNGTLPRKETIVKTISEIKSVPQVTGKSKKPHEYAQIDQSTLATNINEYDVWLDTKIKEIYDNEKLLGFKLEHLRDNSGLSLLGLKQGDIIVSINNKTILNRGELMQTYQTISKMNSLKIVFLRNEKLKELNYEICH